MNFRSHFEPPAPPPFWQSEPLVDTSTRVLGSPANIILYVIFLGLACVALVVLSNWIRNRRCFDARAEEIRLRAVLARNPRIGPDAAWLSTSAIVERLGETEADEMTLRSIELLSAIEARRYGPVRGDE